MENRRIKLAPGREIKKRVKLLVMWQYQLFHGTNSKYFSKILVCSKNKFGHVG